VHSIATHMDRSGPLRVKSLIVKSEQCFCFISLFDGLVLVGIPSDDPDQEKEKRGDSENRMNRPNRCPTSEALAFAPRVGGAAIPGCRWAGGTDAC